MKIRLVDGILSYTFKNIVATRRNPFVTVSEADAEHLLSTGLFTRVEDTSNDDCINIPATDNVTPITSDADNDVPLEKMTVAELDQFAQNIGVELNPSLKKQEKIDILKNYLSEL